MGFLAGVTVVKYDTATGVWEELQRNGSFQMKLDHKEFFINKSSWTDDKVIVKIPGVPYSKEMYRGDVPNHRNRFEHELDAIRRKMGLQDNREIEVPDGETFKKDLTLIRGSPKKSWPESKKTDYAKKKASIAFMKARNAYKRPIEVDNENVVRERLLLDQDKVYNLCKDPTLRESREESKEDKLEKKTRIHMKWLDKSFSKKNAKDMNTIKLLLDGTVESVISWVPVDLDKAIQEVERLFPWILKQLNWNNFDHRFHRNLLLQCKFGVLCFLFFHIVLPFIV